ncbi:hypothetical protein JCM11251_007679 [Rhodosporidiobolus azoricus]
MPQPPSQNGPSALNSFRSAPPTSTNKQQDSARPEDGQRTSLNGTKEGGSRPADSVEEQRRQRGGLLKAQGKAATPSFKPLTGLLPAPSSPAIRKTTATAKAPPKVLSTLAAPPPRPSPAPSTSKLPALKRQKRALATAEELQDWTAEKEAEKRRAEKGKGKVIDFEEVRVEPGTVVADVTKKSRPAAKPPEPVKATFRPVATFGIFSPAPNFPESDGDAQHRTGTPARAAPVPRPLHSLAAMSPFPSPPSKPAKSGDPSHTAPVTRLFGQLPRPVKREDVDDEKPFEAKSILARAPLKPPLLAEDDDVQVVGAGEHDWSPGKKGKKGGYLLSGIASRASSLLSSARTDQTLWLHDFSRTLTSLNLPLPVSSLLQAIPPALRLTVLSIPSFHDTDVAEDVTLRGGRRTLLAQCRLELHNPFPSAEDSSSPPRDLIGLVLFSLHSYPTSSATLPPPSPVKNRKDAHSPNSSSADPPRTLFVPTNPHDLQRYIVRELERSGEHDAQTKKGVEIWVYEPFYPVELLPEPEVGALSPFFPEKKAVETVNSDVGEGTEGVAWDEEVEGWREQEQKRFKAAERQKKALVVSRLAVLV